MSSPLHPPPTAFIILGPRGLLNHFPGKVVLVNAITRLERVEHQSCHAMQINCTRTITFCLSFFFIS